MNKKGDKELPLVSRVNIERKLRRQRSWNRPGDYVHATKGGFGHLLIPLNRTLVEPIELERMHGVAGFTLFGAVYQRRWLMWSKMYRRFVVTTNRGIHNCTTTGVK